MRRVRFGKAGRGFSLVELLAVVLVLAVLAAVAVPLYLNTRKTSAARTCKANLAAIAAAESAYATRFGNFVTGVGVWDAAYKAGAAGVAPTGGLIGAPEGLSVEPKCPLDGVTLYTVTLGKAGDCQITCPNAGQHSTDTTGVNTNTAPWTIDLQPAGNDTTNPL